MHEIALANCHLLVRVSHGDAHTFAAILWGNKALSWESAGICRDEDGGTRIHNGDRIP